MITYRNIVKFQRDKFPEQIKIAQDYLKTIYTDPDFEGIEYIFSSNYRGSHYYRNSNKDFIPLMGKYRIPAVAIANDHIFRIYKMKSLKLNRYKLNIGNYINTICALIHELTHHIQYNEDRTKGELETTRNEVEFLRKYYPDIYNKLTN